MNHRLFEDWLLSEVILLPEQEQELSTHLEACEPCRQLATAWREVQHFMRSVPQAQPAAGFTVRWKERLFVRQLLEKRKNQRRQSWWFLLFTIAGASLLLGFSVSQTLMTIESPLQLFLAGIYRLVSYFSLANAMEGILSTFFSVLIAIVPTTWWLILLGAISLMITLWLISLRRILLPRRITL